MKTINKKAPVVCYNSISINASPEKVWIVLTGIDQWENWLTEIKKTKLNGELKADAKFVWRNGGVTIHSILHTVEPFKNFGWTGKSFGTFAIHNWTLEKVNGQTQVKVEESMEGLPVRLFNKTFYNMLDKGLQSWLVLLKKECEKNI